MLCLCAIYCPLFTILCKLLHSFVGLEFAMFNFENLANTLSIDRGKHRMEMKMMVNNINIHILRQV